MPQNYPTACGLCAYCSTNVLIMQALIFTTKTQRTQRSAERHHGDTETRRLVGVLVTVQSESAKNENRVILSAAKNPFGWVQGCPQAYARWSGSLEGNRSVGRRILHCVQNDTVLSGLRRRNRYKPRRTRCSLRLCGAISVEAGEEEEAQVAAGGGVVGVAGELEAAVAGEVDGGVVARREAHG